MKKAWLQIQIDGTTDIEIALLDELDEKMSNVDNDNLQAEYDLKDEVHIPLTQEEKGELQQKEKAYGKCGTKHTLNQQKAFAVIVG